MTTPLLVAETCPDADCETPIGLPHLRDCHIATCLPTGVQRLLHTIEPPAGDHHCGDQVWAGHHGGAIEAFVEGWFVRPAVPGDPGDGWIPCNPGEPGAVPDLDRVARSGTWNPDKRRWEIPLEAITCG